MLKEEPDIDLTTFIDRFTEDGDYTKDVILEELQYHQEHNDFLCITNGDGFLIGYRHRNSLWIAQGFNNGQWKACRDAIDYAKSWAKDRGMTSLTGATERKQLKAIGRLGWKEDCLLVKMGL